MKKKELSYAEAIAELEETVNSIESGNIEVDMLLDKTRRASFLLRYCREKLRKTEAEVKKVLSEMETGEEDIEKNSRDS